MAETARKLRYRRYTVCDGKKRSAEVLIEGTTEIRRTALFASATEGWLEGIRALLGAGPTPMLFLRKLIESAESFGLRCMRLPPRVTPESCRHFWGLEQLISS